MHNVDLDRVAVFRVETAACHRSMDSMKEESPEMYEEWQRNLRNTWHGSLVNTQDEQNSSDLTGLYAEFGRIVSVGISVYRPGKEEETDSIYSIAFTGDDEKRLLEATNRIIGKYSWAAGHNIKNFDVPYYSKRCIINGLKIPECINNTGKKPWDVRILDTKSIWQYGSMNNSQHSNVHTVCKVLGIENERDPDFGKKVTELYYDRNFETISSETTKGVTAEMKLFMRLGYFDVDVHGMKVNIQDPKMFILDGSAQ
jgi:hypothetical protein